MVLASSVRYRRLEIPAIDALLGAGLFYGGAMAEAKAMEGRDVFVVGAGNRRDRRPSTARATRGG